MIVTSIYLVVDGFFISNFAGKTAFSAVNLVIPVLMILGTVGFMFGAGGTALVAKTYGEGDRDRANRYFSLLVYVAFATGAVLGVIGFAFARPISELLGADGEMLGNAVTYSRIISLALPFFVLEVMFQNFFSAAEKPTLGLAITLLAGLTNVALDAVLVVFFRLNISLSERRLQAFFLRSSVRLFLIFISAARTAAFLGYAKRALTDGRYLRSWQTALPSL